MSLCLRVLGEPLRGFALHSGKRVASCFSSAGFDLPDWFKNPDDGGPCAGFGGDGDDDFVLPAKSETLEERRETATGSGTRPLSILAGCPASHEEAEFEADLDEVSRILSSRFASPEAIPVRISRSYRDCHGLLPRQGVRTPC